MDRRRTTRSNDVRIDGAVGVENEPAAPDTPAVELRKPRHGGWKGKEPGRLDRMLRGEPGYHLGLFRAVYGVLLVQRTLMFMSSGAVDASFAQRGTIPSSPGGGGPSTPQAPRSVFNFGHGFLLLGDLGSPSADVVRSACWCLCAAGAVLSVGYRSNAVAFAASVMQFCLLLLEKSVYTDEAYLFACVGLVLSFTDCGRALAIEASPPPLGARGHGQRDDRSAALRNQPPDTVPHWQVVLLKFQVCIVLIHRGLAKAGTADWLLGGEPLLHTLEAMPPTSLARRLAEMAASSGLPGLGGGGLKALAVRANGTMAFLDLFQGVSLLAAPRYRLAALALQTVTHLALGVLGPPHARPWHLLLVATGLFFLDPFRVRTFVERTRAMLQPAVSYDDGGRAGSRAGGNQARRRPRRASISGGSGGHGEGNLARAQGQAQAQAPAQTEDQGEGQAQGQAKKLPVQPRPSPATLALVSLYVLAQALLPLRHMLGMFPVEWSREGHEFSWRMGSGVGTGGGMVREEALVRVTHRPRGGGKSRVDSRGVQLVHLYGAPLTAQQVLRMVVDPDMLLQLAKKSAESSPAADGGRRGSRSGRDPKEKRPRTPPISGVDAWKSINGRPFSRWIDPSVDVWHASFGDEGPSNAEWLEMPPSDEELSRASAVMEAVRTKWAMRDQRVTFFAARAGQTGLSNVFLGRYDPSNLNTTELCAVPPIPAPAAASEATRETGVPDEEAGGGILLGVALGEVQLLTEPDDGGSEPESRSLRVSTGVVMAPKESAHSVRPSSSSPLAGRRGGSRGALAVWYYVHSCPDGLFHLCAGFLSGAGWQALYPPNLGVRKGWTLEYGVPRS